MAKLTRVTGKVFGGSAPLDEIGQFGSALAGNPTNTQDVATIQALEAYSEGWGSAVVTSRQFPPIEEVTGALKTISYQGCYLLQEGIPEYDANTEYSNTSIVKTVNDGVTTLYVSLANGNKGNALSNATYWKSYVLSSVQRNIGEIVTSTIPLEDSGLHLLDGSLLEGNGIYGNFVTYIAGLVSDYPDLFTTETNWQNTVTAYGACGKFVYTAASGADPATLRLPKIVGFTESTTDVTALGDLVQAGLPNITGTFNVTGADRSAYLTGTGCLADTYHIGGGYQGGNSGLAEQFYNLSVNASRSSSIYGNSSTVQPQAIKVLYYIVVATSAKTDIQVDIDEIATDLNGKADVDLTNINNQGAITIAHNCMPSDTYVDLTLGASGSTYTAPADGWFYLMILPTSTPNNFIALRTPTMQATDANKNLDNSLDRFAYVRKGDTMTLNYNNISASGTFRFYYAIGSESEGS